MLADNPKGSPDNPRNSPDNPRGSPDNPKGSGENCRVRRRTKRSGLLCGPYTSLHAHVSLNSAVLIGVASMKPSSGWSGPADSLKPKPYQECSQKAQRFAWFAEQFRGSPDNPGGGEEGRRREVGEGRGGEERGMRGGVRRGQGAGGRAEEGGWEGRRQGSRGSPDNPKGSGENPRVRRTKRSGLLCGPYTSLHAHVSLNSAVLIGVASMKPLSGWQIPASQNPIKSARGRPAGQPRSSPDNPKGSPDNPTGSPDSPRGSPDNPRVHRTTPGFAGQPRGGLLCGPYKGLHAHVSLNSAVLIGVASMKPLSGWSGPADSLKSSDAYYVRHLLSPSQDYATHATNVDNTIPLMLIIRSVTGRPASDVALL